jgi:hypothetical protein
MFEHGTRVLNPQSGEHRIPARLTVPMSPQAARQSGVRGAWTM